MLSPQQLLGKVEAGGALLVCDLEAGVIGLDRIEFTPGDTVLVVAQPTRNSIDVAQRLAAIASELSARVVVVANRVQGEEQRQAIEDALEGYECVVVPDDPLIVLADREGAAPIDFSPQSPGVVALAALAGRIEP